MSKRPYRFKVFQNGNEGWMWTLHAPNGRIIAGCNQSFATFSHAKRAARDMMLALQVGDVVCP